MKSLLKSRKFLLLVLDTVLSSVLFFAAKYFEVGLEDVSFLVASLQPIFIALIGAIAYEDKAAMENDLHPRS